MKQTLQDLQREFQGQVEFGSFVFEREVEGRRLLELLGRRLGCDWGVLWKVDTERHQLRPTALWSSTPGRALELEQNTVTRTLSPNEGNSGLVWYSKKPICTVDLVRGMCIPRSIDAVKAGLRGGIWFALKTESTVYGVVELLSSDLPAISPEAITELEVLGMRIGDLLEHSH